MRKITGLVDHELTWTQPNGFKSEYELRFGNELVATLRFPKMLSSTAVAESGDGSWTFERTGFFKVKTIIRKSSSETEAGVYRAHAWKGGGVLEMPDGRKYVAATNVWKSSFEFQSEAGETLFRLENRGFFRLSASVRMNRTALKISEFPWMVLVGLYLMVMTRRESAGAAAAGT